MLIFESEWWVSFFFLLSSPKDMFIDFRERGRERRRERERNIEVREKTSIGFLSHMSQLGIKPATKACALTKI